MNPISIFLLTILTWITPLSFLHPNAYSQRISDGPLFEHPLPTEELTLYTLDRHQAMPLGGSLAGQRLLKFYIDSFNTRNITTDWIEPVLDVWVGVRRRATSSFYLEEGGDPVNSAPDQSWERKHLITSLNLGRHESNQRIALNQAFFVSKGTIETHLNRLERLLVVEVCNRLARDIVDSPNCDHTSFDLWGATPFIRLTLRLGEHETIGFTDISTDLRTNLFGSLVGLPDLEVDQNGTVTIKQADHSRFYAFLWVAETGNPVVRPPTGVTSFGRLCDHAGGRCVYETEDPNSAECVCENSDHFVVETLSRDELEFGKECPGQSRFEEYRTLTEPPDEPPYPSPVMAAACIRRSGEWHLVLETMNPRTQRSTRRELHPFGGTGDDRHDCNDERERLLAAEQFPINVCGCERTEGEYFLTCYSLRSNGDLDLRIDRFPYGDTSTGYSDCRAERDRQESLSPEEIPR